LQRRRPRLNSVPVGRRPAPRGRASPAFPRRLACSRMPAPDRFLFDAHTDVPTRLWENPADLRRPCPDRHVDLPRLRAGGVSGLLSALYLPQARSPEEGLRHAEALHAATIPQLGGGQSGDELALVRTPQELDAVVEGGAVGVVL